MRSVELVRTIVEELEPLLARRSRFDLGTPGGEVVAGTRLDDDKLMAIREWIVAGAAND